MGIVEGKLLRGELTLQDQGRLAATLCESTPLSEGLPKPRLIETHISYVLLIGGLVYKIKKAVDFGFLNFSILQMRRFYCFEEVRLNRRFAQNLYLAVVPITGSLTSPRIGGTGETLEFAVQMREFPQDLLGDNLVSQARLSADEIDEFAVTLARLHLTADVAKPDSEFGAPESVLARALENVRDLSKQCMEIDRSIVTTLERWTKDEFLQRHMLFESRKQAGFIRECHGDLHLGNIVRLDGRLTPFDCIEFNADLRWIDVISDIAFLTMDLDYQRRHDFSARLLNRYLEITGDYGGVGLLRFYHAYRAMVRAKVAVLKAKVSPQNNRGCSDHLRLAQYYAAPKHAALIITHGLSGSGKTTLTQPLLEQLGAIRIRSDVERKRMHGLAASERSGSDFGAGLYAPDSTTATYDRLLVLARTLLAAGHAVIVDATFLRQHDRALFRELAEEHSTPFAIVDVYAPADELRRRIVRRAEEGGDASEATLAVLERQLVYREPLTAEERSHVFRLDSTRWVGSADNVEVWKPLIESLSLSNN